MRKFWRGNLHLNANDLIPFKLLTKLIMLALQPPLIDSFSNISNPNRLAPSSRLSIFLCMQVCKLTNLSFLYSSLLLLCHQLIGLGNPQHHDHHFERLSHYYLDLLFLQVDLLMLLLFQKLDFYWYLSLSFQIKLAADWCWLSGSTYLRWTSMRRVELYGQRKGWHW